jgi:hypothetical protein
MGQNDVWPQGRALPPNVCEFRRRWPPPTGVDPHIAADGPAQLLKLLQKCADAGLKFRIVRGWEYADATHAAALLRPRPERPCRRRASEQRDKVAPSHSITSSARASSVGGTVRPNALAVLRLMTSSILVACCTGRSAGFSPLRMRPV